MDLTHRAPLSVCKYFTVAPVTYHSLKLTAFPHFFCGLDGSGVVVFWFFFLILSMFDIHWCAETARTH